MHQAEIAALTAKTWNLIKGEDEPKWEELSSFKREQLLAEGQGVANGGAAATPFARAFAVQREEYLRPPATDDTPVVPPSSVDLATIAAEISIPDEPPAPVIVNPDFTEPPPAPKAETVLQRIRGKRK